MTRIPCSKCDNTILEATSKITGGVCMPCKKKADRQAIQKEPVIPSAIDIERDHLVDLLEKRLKSVLGANCKVAYSAYPQDQNQLPIDNLDDVAVDGQVKFIQNYDPFWGDGKDYESNVIVNPTWMKVAQIAEEMIGVTKDRQHHFLEGVTYLRSEGDVSIYELDMGS